MAKDIVFSLHSEQIPYLFKGYVELYKEVVAWFIEANKPVHVWSPRCTELANQAAIDYSRIQTWVHFVRMMNTATGGNWEVRLAEKARREGSQLIFESDSEALLYARRALCRAYEDRLSGEAEFFASLLPEQTITNVKLLVEDPERGLADMTTDAMYAYMGHSMSMWLAKNSLSPASEKEKPLVKLLCEQDLTLSMEQEEILRGAKAICHGVAKALAIIACSLDNWRGVDNEQHIENTKHRERILLKLEATFTQILDSFMADTLESRNN